MSYKKCTIKKMIDEIDQSKVYLPALQRKFVWGKHQIELLFDSLMRNYPFGTFLFWNLHKLKASQYVFYDFLKEYDERMPYNHRKEGAFTHEEIIGVLDGQQRLSSMFIGLMGTHTEKAPYKRTYTQDAYPKMALYLNLLSLPLFIDEDDEIQIKEDQNFEFRFQKLDDLKIQRQIEKTDSNQTGFEPVYWMLVGKSLFWKIDPEFEQIYESLKADCKSDSQRIAFLANKRFIMRVLNLLHTRIQKDELINYFEVTKDDLEDILKIFVRVNSGGTVLSKTDLLFSTIVATWDNGREKIEELLKKINGKGDGFNFGNEFLMRCALVLSDNPVLFKVNSFKSENVQKIRDQWNDISESINVTIDLLVEFGFSGELLSSHNAVVIIAYYIFKKGSIDGDSKFALKKYLVHALLNGLYGSSQDQIIATFRNALRVEKNSSAGIVDYQGRFKNIKFQDFLSIELPQQKTLKITENDLDRFMVYTKGPQSFLVLTLLYPHLKYTEVVFHQDHIHPYSKFCEEEFIKMNLLSDQMQAYNQLRDTTPNLQLLEGKRNESKNNKTLVQWLMLMNDSERQIFKNSNYFPVDIDCEFSSFIEFIASRKEILKAELRKVLAMETSLNANTVLEIDDQDYLENAENE